MSDRTHQAKGDHIQQLQQQIEAWQALQDKVFIAIGESIKTFLRRLNCIQGSQPNLVGYFQ